ncbi:uncharacterized protein YtbQ-like [Saccoglossus kowalevskii]|uniref:NAD dependent nucleoside-diphosphate-sugar epimerase-like protein 230 n=1 Tax=Saccoglossus kowalevskii TaxID=10224 RepID=A0A1L7H7A1_SACKO|nr:NAD dependent nucleoside-diphosphate-sugar epimerase-like protein 230 [Saccoglossus kowalevskii]
MWLTSTPTIRDMLRAVALVATGACMHWAYRHWCPRKVGLKTIVKDDHTTVEDSSQTEAKEMRNKATRTDDKNITDGATMTTNPEFVDVTIMTTVNQNVNATTMTLIQEKEDAATMTTIRETEEAATMATADWSMRSCNPKPASEDNTIKRVGITGAAGIIGTILRENLGDNEDFEIVNFTLKYKEVDDSVGFDLSNATTLRGKFDDLDCVIHLAADKPGNATWPGLVKNNIIATYNVFEECVRAGVKKIIFASTNHVQSGHTVMTFDLRDSLDRKKVRGYLNESDDPFPSCLYGVSKLFGENLGRLYSAKFGFDVVCLRIGWVSSDDDPSYTKGNHNEEYMRAMYLSKRDCVGAVQRALKIKPPNGFLICNVISANDSRVLSLETANRVMGFYPRDNSELYWS